MSETFGETMAHIDAAIEDWETGPDAASWAADGSHEHDPAWWTRQDMSASWGVWPVRYDWGQYTAEDAERNMNLLRDRVREAYAPFIEMMAETFERVQEGLRSNGYGIFTRPGLDEAHEFADGGNLNGRVVVPFEVDGTTRQAVIEPALTISDVSRLFDIPEDMLTVPIVPSNEVRIHGIADRLPALLDAYERRNRRSWPNTGGKA